MNRLSLLIFASLAGACLQAQTFSTITISTVPTGAKFLVDGQLYINTATLSWPVGSTHVLVFVTDPPLPGQAINTVQTTSDGSTQYTFSGWVDNAGLLQPSSDPIQTITANPAVTSLTATLTVAFRVMLNFFNAPNLGSTPVCGAPGFVPQNQLLPGLVEINGVCYLSSANIFLPANSKVLLNAFPYPGFVFIGWASNSGPTNPYLNSLNLTGPITLAPQFSPGKLVHFLTSPLGLNVWVDHTSVPTRNYSSNLTGPCPSNESISLAPGLGIPPVCFGDFYFAPGSMHVISGVSPQLDMSGKWWVFNQWSNGAGANAVYTTDNSTATPDTLTADFVPGAQISFVTIPAGLTLNIDGRQNWPSFNFIWGLGSTHQVSAAATQFDAKTRQYTFQGWSNKGAASQTVNVDQTAVNNGLRMIATYSVLSRVVVESAPPGQTVQVDGTSCQTPCNVDRQTGTKVHVTAQTQIPMGAGSRLDFNSWSDGGASDHVITVSQDYTLLTANYTSSYQLSASSTPSNGVSFQFSPTSSDMFYAQNTQVSVTASPNPGFKFLRWNGALTGTFPSGVVTMSSPESVIAQLNTVPYIAPAGVMNAAGVTPVAAVAPGSIISIFGQGLSSTVQVGPVNPLAQTLSGTTVTVNSEILPLLFVSAQQINAQLPSDLSDGAYTLLVHNNGQQDVTANLTVARNAPGLFSQGVNSQSYVIALHADGSAISSNSPAAAGETISILGTGFGPYSGTILDGFYPPVPPPAVADSVTITLGGQNPAVNWSGAASGFTGVVSTTFTVPTGLPSGAPAALKVTVNGVDSNTAMLPIQ